MTVREIQGHLAELYGTEVSPDLTYASGEGHGEGSICQAAWVEMCCRRQFHGSSS